MNGLKSLVVLTIAMVAVAGCASDTPNATAPQVTEAGQPQPNVHDANAIVVSSTAELVAALIPQNAGRTILVRAGNYDVTQPLTVPDKVTLEGESVMHFDHTGLAVGFAKGTGTTLTMTANVPGNILTLGDSVTVRRIAMVDIAGRPGNVIGVVSRVPGDRISATVEEVQIINPNAHVILPAGGTGCGLYVVTQNPNLGSDPPAHAGAAITARLSRSVIRSTSAGTTCGLFAFNFAPLASVSVTLSDNVVGGGIIVNGGVSRPDAVHDSRTNIESTHNLYHNDSPDLCLPRRLGWNAQGGSGPPAPLPVGETRANALHLNSLNDRIAGFTTGIDAAGARRFFAAPVQGPATGNSADLQLIGTVIETPSCGGASFVADLRLAGVFVGGNTFAPGDSNTLRAVIHRVTGSGPRFNVYGDVVSPAGPVPPELQGTGNRLEITGSQAAFFQANHAIDPAPGPAFFKN